MKLLDYILIFVILFFVSAMSYYELTRENQPLGAFLPCMIAPFIFLLLAIWLYRETKGTKSKMEKKDWWVLAIKLGLAVVILIVWVILTAFMMGFLWEYELFRSLS